MQHDVLLPRPPGGLAPGAALALAVHAALIAALAMGVDWRVQTPEVVSAELWSAVPQAAAPRAEPVPTPAPTPAPAPAPTPAPAPPPKPVPPAPPPPAPAPAPRAAPPPPDPQIAIEQAREKERQRARERELQLAREQQLAEQKALQQERLKQERLQKAQAAKVEAEKLAEKKKREAEAQKAEEQRLAQQREDNLKRMLGQVPAGTGAVTSTGTAARSSGPSQAYAGLLRKAIKDNIVFFETLPGNPAAEVEVSATASGAILSRRLTKSSGVPDWDAAVLRAIDRTATLPRDIDGRVPPRIVITFRPND